MNIYILVVSNPDGGISMFKAYTNLTVADTSLQDKITYRAEVIAESPEDEHLLVKGYYLATVPSDKGQFLNRPTCNQRRVWVLYGHTAGFIRGFGSHKAGVRYMVREGLSFSGYRLALTELVEG